MKRILTSKDMKNADQTTIDQYKILSAVLMERAALAVRKQILFYLSNQKENAKKVQIVIVCGSGNNGGDGFALARLLLEENIKATILFVGDNDKMQPEVKRQRECCEKYGLVCLQENFNEKLDSADILVDAVFGIGLSRDIEEPYKTVITQMNHSHAYKIAIDIPSGIDATTGHRMGCAVKCDETVTFSFLKVGHLLYPGRSFSGRITLVPIGIGEQSLDTHTSEYYAMEKQDLRLLPQREAYSNKATYGKVLIIAGCRDMAGAAYLSAAAALHTGCGMVKIVTPECNRTILQQKLPEALLSTYSEKWNEKKLLSDMQWADQILIGPGIGLDASSRAILKFVMANAAVPMVVDADALNILAEDIHRLLHPHTEMVITPHLGEMSRLKNESVSFIAEHMIETAEEFAREYQVICVLKDAASVTAVPFCQTYINTSGNDGMATAGSGDVLSGIIVSLMAQGMEAKRAAPLAVFIHGMAGDRAAESEGKRYMSAASIIRQLQYVLQEDM